MANDITLLSIGDASIDTFITPTDSQTLCQLSEHDCLICFSYGDKIPVKTLEFSTGGNAANNAVGLSRLGVKAGILITVGEDPVAAQITENLGKEKVDTTYLFKEPEGRSNYSTIINYQGERTIFVYHAPRTYKFPENLETFPWMYLTSMGESFEPFYESVYNFMLKNKDTKLSFNPGSWQFRAGVEKLKNILSLTHILFVNKEEAEKLTGLSQATDGEKDLLQALAKLGPKISIITDGENGAFAFDGTRFLKVGVLPINAFERTGAGDAFGSGCLGALIKGKTLDEALLWGLCNSSSVIGYSGPQKGLLHDSEMPAWLERCRSSNVKVEEF